MNQKKIFIVDDHPLFREGLKSILNRIKNYTMVGECGTVNESLDRIAETKPDLVIIDISLPDGNGIQIAKEIKDTHPKIITMIISMHSKIDYFSKAFQAGASGYIV